MTLLKEQLEEYLALRKALGFNIRPVAAPLRNFVEFTKAKNANPDYS